MPGGRPSKLTDEIRQEAESLALTGLTIQQMAVVWDVAPSTVDKWIAEDQEFSGSIKRGRMGADSHVARSLFERALGGDTTACIFWLKNRQPQSWRDIQDVDHRHKGDVLGELIDEIRKS